jgi:tRNA(Ile)-lysidine synthase
MRNDTELFAALETFWQKHVLASSRICVAVSGGADSSALFHALARMRKRLGIAKLGIAHVNHRLRGRESDGDERFVRAMAEKARVPFHLKRLSRQEIPARGIEDWARRQRYAFFASVMKTRGYDYTATAHTADDQAETVLLRILRGCGIRGLAGIAQVRDDRVIRPLLAVQKTTLIKWLLNHNLGFREDSSNTNTDYARNWIRHRFLPEFAKKEPRSVQLLSSIAENAAAVDRIMRPLVNKWINRHVMEKGRDYFSVDKKGLKDAAVAEEAIMSLLRERGVEFDRFHVESIGENREENGKTFLLPSGWRYRPGKEIIEFYKGDKKGTKSSFSYHLAVGATTRCGSQKAVFSTEKLKRTSNQEMSYADLNVAFLDAGKLKGKGPMVFRSFSPDEKFRPYGAAGYTKINEFLKKQKVLQCERGRKGVISLKNGEILWIVGMRISENFKITPQTREVLKISYEPV